VVNRAGRSDGKADDTIGFIGDLQRAVVFLDDAIVPVRHGVVAPDTRRKANALNADKAGERVASLVDRAYPRRAGMFTK
jgi:hypothetical protein